MKLKHALLYFVVFFLFGCSASTKMYKKGLRYEESGLDNYASNCYIEALILKNENEKARIGLISVGKSMVNKFEANFLSYYNNKEYKQAYDKYNELIAYKKKLKNVNVDVDINKNVKNKFKETTLILAEIYYQDAKKSMSLNHWVSAIDNFKVCVHYVSNYKDSKNLIYESKQHQAERHYLFGKKFFKEKNWHSAIEQFTKSNDFIPSYKDTKRLLQSAENFRLYDIAESYYKEGLSFFSKFKYRDAYSSFERCNKYQKDFKNTKELMRKSLRKGKIRIGIVPFKNSTSLYGKESLIYANVLSRLVNSSTKWLEYLDRNNLDRILAEQNLGLSGIVDKETAAAKGKMLGLRYIIIGNIVNARYYEEGLRKEPVTAWVAEKKRWQGHDVEVGRKVTYYIYSNRSNAKIDFSYQIIDTRTGQIVQTDVLSRSCGDHIRYARYDGDPDDLLESDPTPEWYKHPPENAKIAEMQLTMELLKGLGRVVEAVTKNNDIFSKRSNLQQTSAMYETIVDDLSYDVFLSMSGYFKKYR